MLCWSKSQSPEQHCHWKEEILRKKKIENVSICWWVVGHRLMMCGHVGLGPESSGQSRSLRENFLVWAFSWGLLTRRKIWNSTILNFQVRYYWNHSKLPQHIMSISWKWTIWIAQRETVSWCWCSQELPLQHILSLKDEKPSSSSCISGYVLSDSTKLLLL